MDTIKFLKIDDKAIIPTKRDEDAAFDLYTIGAVYEPHDHPEVEDVLISIIDDEVIIRPGETVKFLTGLKAVIPSDVWVLLKERSSTAKTGLSIRSGVIDSGYRGEWAIMMTNCGRRSIHISRDYHDKPEIREEGRKDEYGYIDYWLMSFDKAIAQAVVMPKLNVGCGEISQAEFNAAPKTIRGDSGWGASGK